jgi:hypothetical protein
VPRLAYALRALRIFPGFSGLSSSVHDFSKQRNKQETTREKEDAENRNISDEPSYVFFQLQPFSQAPFLARIPLLHQEAHESLDVSCLIQYEIPVLLDLRAEHVRYHAVHTDPSELYRYGCREYSATRRISHSSTCPKAARVPDPDDRGIRSKFKDFRCCSVTIPACPIFSRCRTMK